MRATGSRTAVAGVARSYMRFPVSCNGAGFVSTTSAANPATERRVGTRPTNASHPARTKMDPGLRRDDEQ
jgi:hypothetical protein